MTTSSQLLTILALGAAAIAMTFNAGVVHAVRYSRTREKRQRRLALTLGLLGPLLSALAVYGGCALILNRVGTETIGAAGLLSARPFGNCGPAVTHYAGAFT